MLVILPVCVSENGAAFARQLLNHVSLDHEYRRSLSVRRSASKHVFRLALPAFSHGFDLTQACNAEPHINPDRLGSVSQRCRRRGFLTTSVRPPHGFPTANPLPPSLPPPHQ